MENTRNQANIKPKNPNRRKNKFSYLFYIVAALIIFGTAYASYFDYTHFGTYWAIKTMFVGFLLFLFVIIGPIWEKVEASLKAKREKESER